MLLGLAACTVAESETSTTFASGTATMTSSTTASSAGSDESGSSGETSGGETSDAEATSANDADSDPAESSGGAPVCGDDTKDPTEPCDGTDVGAQTCAGLGLGGGTLGCLPDCSDFDTAGCMAVAMCGNATKEGTEQCDGADLGGQSCATLGFDMGVLACTATCQFDTAGCSNMVCAPEFMPCDGVPCCEGLFCYPFDPPVCGPTP
jgi:hypothetical protein